MIFRFEAPPVARGNAADGNEGELRESEEVEGDGDAAGEAVGVEADAKLIDAEERPAGDDVSADGEDGQAAVGDQLVPAGVQDERVPEDDDQGAVFFRIPAPEAAPGIVGPKA